MDNKGIGIAILIGLGLLGLWFFTRKAGPLLPTGGTGYVGQPLRLMPAGSGGMLHYKNKETRNVERTDEGLPL